MTISALEKKINFQFYGVYKFLIFFEMYVWLSLSDSNSLQFEILPSS